MQDWFNILNTQVGKGKHRIRSDSTIYSLYREGFKGRKCECETDSINEELRKKCKDEESGLECGGHGKCHCGICTCDKGYLGPKCLQSIHDCPKHNGQGK